MSRHVLTGRSDQQPSIDSAPAIGLAWLVRLRWAFIVAEILVALGARLFLETSVSAWWVTIAAGTTALTNVGLLTWSRRGRHASRVLLATVLVLDGMLLTVALRASGGAMNPFSVLYLVHVALAALLLDGRATWIVAGATCLGFAALFLGASPHGSHHHDHRWFDLHLRGMLVAYALAAAFVGYFVYRVARALERREREMIALRDWAARSERVASLSALAAGAAHELGTPLATIAVVAKEVERAALAVETGVDRAVLSSDARLLREEAERCRRIIAKMAAHSGEVQGTAPRHASVDDVLDRVRTSLDKRGSLELRMTLPRPAFVVVPDEALVQALVNLVSNAFDACAASPVATVTISAEVARDRVAFSVEDRGCGMPDEVLRHLGEPFFSTKREGGMGLGLFLARSFAERVGGTLSVESHIGAGTRFVLEVPGGAR
jgi:two-component system sensor histidine kinase RegB